MSLEHLVDSGVKEVLKKKREGKCVRGTRSQRERVAHVLSDTMRRPHIPGMMW